MRICSNCGQKNDDVNFCSSCGHDLRTQTSGMAFCRHCGAAQNSEDNIHCCKCGKWLKGRKKGKYIWIFLALAIGSIVCCLMLFRQNGDDVPQEIICQHEWQNNGVTSICTKCSGVIITPTEDMPSKETANQNAVAQEKEKRVSSITQYSGDEVSVVTMYDYDMDGNLLCVERKNWYNGENNYTITTDYIYNADGQLIAKKDADAPINDVEYIYDGNIRKGYVENTYWLYDDGSYQLESSVEYAYVRDSNGNVIEKTTVNPQQEPWTAGTYSYDADNHLIAAYEERRSGDHHFKLKYSFDYSYKGLIVVSCKGTVSAYDYSDTIVILSDLSCGAVSVELYLTEDVNLITDEEGYITEIRNSDNELVCEVSYALNQMPKSDEYVEADVSAEETESLSTAPIDMDCDHIFEVFNGKHRVETRCRFCGISMDDLNDAGIELPHVDCEHDYETVMQTNGAPAYECKKCHNIMIKPSAYFTELKLLSDTNAKGKTDDVKFGTFYHNGWEWNDAVRFWVADKSGYTNTESLEVYLAKSYTFLEAIAFADHESDDNANMTLRFYGDGELLYEMTDITKDAEEKSVRIDITDIEVLKVECSTTMDAFGYCVLQGNAWW